MHGAFWFGYDFKDLIFSGINVSSGTGFLLASACVFAVALLYEALKICLALVKLNSTVFRSSKGQQCISDELVLIENKTPVKSKRYFLLLSETAIYTTEVIFAYILMLIVMTYNFYFIMTALFATGLTFSLFGQRLYEVKFKTTKIKLTCNDCSKGQKCSSPSSSSEVMTESVTMNIAIETNCCDQVSEAAIS